MKRSVTLLIACIISGNNYQAVRRYDTYSKKKVVVLATAIGIPTIIWILNGFILPVVVLGKPIYVGLISSLICGSVVYAIERMIVNSDGGKVLVRTRVMLAIVLACLGSFSIKEAIFHPDTMVEISREIIQDTKQLNDDIRKGHQADINKLQKDLDDANTSYREWDTRFSKEAEGKISNHIGIGPIARSYLAQRDAVMKTRIIPIKAKLDSIDNVIKDEVKKQQAFKTANAGLMAMIVAFAKLTFRTVAGTVIFLLLFALFFTMEVIVVVLKVNMRKSKMEHHEEELSKYRAVTPPADYIAPSKPFRAQRIERVEHLN